MKSNDLLRLMLDGFGGMALLTGIPMPAHPGIVARSGQQAVVTGASPAGCALRTGGTSCTSSRV